MGPIYSSRPLPKTHFTDDPRGYLGKPVCGVAPTSGFVPYVTSDTYRVDCGRCEAVLDARQEKRERDEARSASRAQALAARQ